MKVEYRWVSFFGGQIIDVLGMDDSDECCVMDQLCAEGMGLEPIGDRWHQPGLGDKNCCDDLLDYCGSIAAAWEIVEKYGKLDEDGFYFELSRNPFHWESGWTDSAHSTWRAYAEAATAPMAICLAFLKLP